MTVPEPMEEGAAEMDHLTRFTAIKYRTVGPRGYYGGEADKDIACLLAELERQALDRIEYENPGIDMEQVRALREGL